MISKGIRIFWDSSVEYIELDPSDESKTPSINTTIEWWKTDREWVKYNTLSNVKKYQNGEIEIQLTYDSALNLHLDPNDICFGKATIYISPGEQSGRAYWDDNESLEDSGDAKWELVSIPLIGERKRETVTRIQRKQEEFRSALIACDKQCVLSGTISIATLEAAHLVSASLGGAEIIGNGVLLRADLHRLFDAHLFSFDAKGFVVINKSLEPSYRKLLKGKRLPGDTFKRVKAALHYINST